MVVKKSEYQKQYKSCLIKKNEATYLENLKTRLTRRDREFMHTPLCWEELNEEEEKSSSDCGEEEQPKPTYSRVEPQEQYKSLAEILTNSREKEEASRKNKLQGDVIQSASRQHELSKDSEEVYGQEVKDRLEGHIVESAKTHINDIKNKKSNTEPDLSRTQRLVLTAHQEAESHESSASNCLKNKQRLDVDRSEQIATNKVTNHYKNDKAKGHEGRKSTTLSSTRKGTSKIQNAESHHQFLQPSHKLRPKSASSHGLASEAAPADFGLSIPKLKLAPTSPQLMVRARPPFAAYGNADKEDCLATHRTHNVRALTDVYPAAIRAKTRHQLQIKSHKEKMERAHSAEYLPDRFSANTLHSLADWESEYKKQFHSYEPKVYERAISSHAIIPRASQVRAVHRGGCLLVHVD